jgi:hypothetical protein
MKRAFVDVDCFTSRNMSKAGKGEKKQLFWVAYMNILGFGETKIIRIHE